MSRSLTGGTGDVNPQWLKLRVTQSAADTTTTLQQNLPVQRLQNKGRAMIMEVLKTYWILSAASVEVDSQIGLTLTTKTFGTTTVQTNEPTAIDTYQERRLLTTSGMLMPIYPVEHDLTDGVGHGVLVATDSIFLQCGSSGTSASNVGDVWILYRWKDVGLTEYIGIVQSQQ